MSRLESEPRRFNIQTEYTTASKLSREIQIESQKVDPRLVAPIAYPVERRELAIAEFEREVKPLGILLQNAKVLIANQEYRLAVHILVDILRRDSSNELAIRSLGECHYHLKEWDKAERILKIAADISPLASTLVMYADVLYVQGKNEDALKVYQELLIDFADEQEELFNVYKAMGNIYVRQGDLDSAEENYHKAFAIRPDSDLLLVNYGTLEIQRGQMQAALERYRQALMINDKNEKAWIGVAMIHREYGDKELGWGNLHKALDLDPSNHTAIQLMADWAIKDHKLAEVIERLEKYLSINDQDAEKSLLLAKLFFVSGREDLARTEAVRAINLDPAMEGGLEFFDLMKKSREQVGEATC